MSEYLVDTFKRALSKAKKEVTHEIILQQFLRVTLNLNTLGRSSPVELMFVRKEKLSFNKLLPVEERKCARKDISKLVITCARSRIKTERSPGKKAKLQSTIRYGVKSTEINWNRDSQKMNQIDWKHLRNGCMTHSRCQHRYKWLNPRVQVEEKGRTPSSYN